MLTGRVAIVLGADRLLGTACADALAAVEARVALVAPQPSPAFDRLLNGWTPMQMACWIYDMAQSELTDCCLRSIGEVWARPTILINCLQPHRIESELANTRALLFAHRFIAHLQQSGCEGTLIHVLPSVDPAEWDNGEPRHTCELRQLTERLAAACAAKGIRVNMIQTGPEYSPYECEQRSLARIHAEQIGWTVSMLSSAPARAITGTIIRADAGFSLAERQAGRI